MSLPNHSNGPVHAGVPVGTQKYYVNMHEHKRRTALNNPVFVPNNTPVQIPPYNPTLRDLQLMNEHMEQNSFVRAYQDYCVII